MNKSFISLFCCFFFMSSQAMSQNTVKDSDQDSQQATQNEKSEALEEELEKLKAIYETEVFEEQELEEENIVDTSEAMVFMSNT